MIGETVIFGLGRFGRSVARELSRQGIPVLVVDANRALVQTLSTEVDAAVCADATDEAALAELHLERMSCAVVAIGEESLEASILTTMLLRQLGVPRVVARSTSDLHSRVLRAVGAHEVINPEAEMGERLARRLAQPNVLDRLDLGDGVNLADIEVPASFVGQSLIGLDVRKRYGLLVVAIRRNGKVLANPQGTERFADGDVILAIGSPEAIDGLARLV